MIKRSICIFPDFNNSAILNEIRMKYDPLYHKIPPHITLVFPFESNIPSDRLKKHVENVLFPIKPFMIKLREITGAGNRYLFLNVKEGNDRLTDIHDRLYSGLLKKYHIREVTYLPHVTVGRLANKEEFLEAIERTSNLVDTFECNVGKVVSEVIDENENSTVEFTVSL